VTLFCDAGLDLWGAGLVIIVAGVAPAPPVRVSL
jgi:hypothetical protein